MTVGDPIWSVVEPPSPRDFLAFDLQPFPLLPVIAIALAAIYLTGAIRLWSAGRSWPIWRAVLFLLGCLAIFAVTGLGIEGYGFELFSVFMFQQLTLMMAVPPLLVLGSPGTLLLRSLPHNRLGGCVHRQSIRLLRSRVSRFLIHPGFTLPIFLISFYGLYLGGLADFFLATLIGHLSLEVFFLISGILFTIPILSADPLPRRQSYAGRIMDLFGEGALHAFFGVIVMMAPAPLMKTFTTPPPSWAVDLVYDQQIAGALSWSYGELPTVIILMFLLPRWFRDDTRKAKAADRHADRFGDPELDAYNDYLAGLRKRDERYSIPAPNTEEES